MKYGMIATGSKEASEAALEILKLGGNAFDASIAAVMTSMTSEVNLTSMAGGGAMLAYQNGKAPILYDFFVDAPPMRNRDNFEFYKTKIDFGDTDQAFHIGKGSIAIPGNIKGLLHAHSALGVLPLKEVTSPAIQIAREGVTLSKAQSYITSLLSDIINTSSDSRKLFYRDGKVIKEGDVFSNPDLANFLEWITEEGDRPFYEGELGRKLISYLDSDGLIQMEDLNAYKVFDRSPLEHKIHNRKFFTNPSPSVGGTLIVFFLKLLQRINEDYIYDDTLMIKLMQATTNARFKFFTNPNSENQLNQMLEREVIEYYLNLIQNNASVDLDDFSDNGLGSTTHVSIIDKDGNAASITTTNGESCGHVLPGTGVILNNMLGEQDLNPLGFHNWTLQKRMPTLISPSLLLSKSGEIKLVIGSAGSNRIRSAVIQVMMKYLNSDATLRDSVYSSRLHLEESNLYLEPGFDIDKSSINKKIEINRFSDINLFFGGVNAVTNTEAVSDPRRGGVSIEC